MIMEKRITSLSEQIDKHLSELQDKYNDMMELARIATAFLAQQIEVLQAFVSGHVFENETEEIAFFKDINPCFYSKYIYYQHISHIESSRRPGGSPDLQQSMLVRQLRYIDRFFKEQLSFIIYHLVIIF